MPHATSLHAAQRGSGKAATFHPDDPTIEHPASTALQLPLVSCWQELDCWNAVVSSPFASSCFRLVMVALTCVFIVATVVVAVVTAAVIPVMPDASSTALLTASTSACSWLVSVST